MRIYGSGSQAPDTSTTLIERFHQEGRRVVFWHDPAREFEESLPALVQALDGVSLLRLDEHPALAIKVQLEQDDPSGRYLLYAPFDPPAPEQDWLLDIRLHSGSLSADRASLSSATSVGHHMRAGPLIS